MKKLISIVLLQFSLVALSHAAIDPAATTEAPKEAALETTTSAPAVTVSEPAWELTSDEDGIKVYRREIEGSSIVEFKGETVIPATVAKIAEVLTDTPRKYEWVDRIHTAKDIALISPTERIEYNRTKAPWPVKDRDFVFKASGEVIAKDRTLVVTIKSVEHNAMPEQDCCVRGELKNSTYTLKALGDGSETRITVQIHADPKGSVPTWIVNMIQKSWPRKTLQALREQTAKPDVAENTYFQELFKKAGL